MPLPTNDYAAEIAALKADVAKGTAVEASAQTLIAGLVKHIRTAAAAAQAGNPADIHALAATIEAQQTALAASVAANAAVA